MKNYENPIIITVIMLGRLRWETIIIGKSAGSRKMTSVAYYVFISKIFRTGAVQIIKIINKLVCKLPTSTQLRAAWRTDSLDMVVLQSTGASRYHNCYIDGGTSPEYFG
jgi:hypothetical protein